MGIVLGDVTLSALDLDGKAEDEMRERVRSLGGEQSVKGVQAAKDLQTER